MAIDDFIHRASGRVRLTLCDGSIHTGRFRTDILSQSALAVYFDGDVHDISLPIADIDSVESIQELQLAS